MARCLNLAAALNKAQLAIFTLLVYPLTATAAAWASQVYSSRLYIDIGVKVNGRHRARSQPRPLCGPAERLEADPSLVRGQRRPAQPGAKPESSAPLCQRRCGRARGHGPKRRVAARARLGQPTRTATAINRKVMAKRSTWMDRKCNGSSSSEDGHWRSRAAQTGPHQRQGQVRQGQRHPGSLPLGPGRDRPPPSDRAWATPTTRASSTAASSAATAGQWVIASAEAGRRAMLPFLALDPNADFDAYLIPVERGLLHLGAGDG